MEECTIFNLRKPLKEDAVELKRIRNDEETMLYFGIEGAYPKTILEAEKEIEWALTCFKEGGGRWTIADKICDMYIGDIGFFNYDKDHNRAELGFVLDRLYWNKGIMSEAIAHIVRKGFEQFRYNRIQAYVDIRNEASKKVLVKNGFQKEGTLREYECEHGEYVDLDIYAILRREYSSKTL